jgi:hypothetical protein
MPNKMINLLPADLNVSRTSGRTGIVFRRLSFFVAIVFFLSNALFVGYTLYLNHQLGLELKKKSGLRANIENLNQAEQRLFLIKDRISKVERIFDSKSSENSISKLDKTIVSATESSGMTFRNAKLAGVDTELTLTTSTLLNVSDFLNSFVLSSPYGQVILKNLGFNSFLGYSIDMQMF